MFVCRPGLQQTRKLAMLTYTADQLRSFNRDVHPPPGSFRKAIFSHHLWQPRQRKSPSADKQGCGISFGLLNVQSVTEKSVALCDVITSRRLDVFALTETWHQDSDDLPLKRSAPPGYSIVDVPRRESRASTDEVRGGGVALIYSNRFTAKRITLDIKPTTFEVLCCSLRSASVNVVYVVIYRPGSAHLTEQFFDELISLLEIVATYRHQVIVAGDFNIHVNDANDQNAVRLAELLASLDLHQVVSQPTHKRGNTLDLVVTRPDARPSCCTVDPPDVISDHSLVVCQFPSIPFAARLEEYTYRPWKRIDRDAFNRSLMSSPLCASEDELRRLSAAELFDIYDGTLRRIADHHAPASTIVRRPRRLSPWFDGDCRRSRRVTRRLERRYRWTKNSYDRAAWVAQMRSMHALYNEKENTYWTSRINSCAGDSKKLWRSLTSILRRDKQSSMPIPSLTAEKLSQFFVDKISAVRTATENSDPPVFSVHAGQQFTSFKECTHDEIRLLLSRSPSKSCPLDPVPTEILLGSVDLLLPFISVMCNTSLREGVLPASQKAALITPVMKKPSLDPDEEKSHRPISNLSFISKLIERIVAQQLKVHLDASGLMPSVQSGFRQGHSTETAVLKVLSDILDAADCQKVTLLGLLDMSAAFDTVDHQILLRRLEVSYGVNGQALQWIRSFLTDRTQAVGFAGSHSRPRGLTCGVPQGSVLGPLLFVLYSADVVNIAAQYGVRIHAYADDLQTYASCAATDQQTATTRLLACIAEIDRWMSSNRLKLNGEKTEFIWLGTRQQLAKISPAPLQVGGQFLLPLDKVRDLGVIIDSQLAMDAHVSNVVRSCFYHLRQLRTVRRSLTFDAKRTLVTAFIASRVDYCNAVLHGVPAYIIRRLQMVMNAAARLIVGAGKYEHITPVLRDVLHWLPVPQRIEYKMATLVFNCIRGTGPSYLRDVCVPVSTVPGRSSLRSADRGDLVVPRTRTAKLGRRSFTAAAPAIWNSLPLHLRSPSISRGQFSVGLKTHLFQEAYQL